MMARTGLPYIYKRTVPSDISILLGGRTSWWIRLDSDYATAAMQARALAKEHDGLIRRLRSKEITDQVEALQHDKAILARLHEDEHRTAPISLSDALERNIKNIDVFRRFVNELVKHGDDWRSVIMPSASDSVEEIQRALIRMKEADSIVATHKALETIIAARAPQPEPLQDLPLISESVDLWLKAPSPNGCSHTS
jgi:hypothetical protein